MKNKKNKSLLLFLFSHHLPDEVDHIIQIPIGRNKILLCARCTSMWLGFFSSLFLFNYLILNPVIMNVIIFILSIVPGTADWILEKITNWKGSKLIRILTGFLLGIPLGFLVASPFYGRFDVFLIYFCSSCIYFVILALIFAKSDKIKDRMKKHIEAIMKFINNV